MDVVERQYNDNKKGKTFYNLGLKPSVYLLYLFFDSDVCLLRKLSGTQNRKTHFRLPQKGRSKSTIEFCEQIKIHLSQYERITEMLKKT